MEVSSQNFTDVEICSTIITSGWQCTTPNYHGCNDEDGCDHCGTYCTPIDVMTEVCWTFTVGDGGGKTGTGTSPGGNAPPPGSGGGGSGSGIPPADPCNNIPDNPTDPYTAQSNVIDPGNCPPPTGGPGWVPIEDQPGEYNPYYADEVIVDTSITNNYPCVSRIIDSLTNYSNINALAQVALHNVFGVNQKIKLSIVATNLPSNIDGETEPGNINDPDSVYTTKIHINKKILSSSTQEYIASTIIHEAVHAYIRYCQHQVQNGYMDTTKFKNLFPLFWPPRIAYVGGGTNYYSIGSSVQHQVMASNLIYTMTQPLINLFPNPGISPSMRDSIYTALSWGGLSSTPAFYAHPDTLFIHAMNEMARDTSIHAPFQFNGVSFQYDSHNLNLVPGCQ